MSILSRKLMGTGAGGGILVDDVFSTDLYTGNGSTQTITNGIDLASEGGLVWIKGRNAAPNHQLFDTGRGATKELISNLNGTETTDADTLTSFNADGFSLGADSGVNNGSGTFVAHTLRQAENFFSVVTYTGDGVSGRTVAHNLGVAPGMIVVKRTDGPNDWTVYHRSNISGPETEYLVLNSTAGSFSSSAAWNNTLPTDTVFTLGNATQVNAGGGSFVAYIFAHDDGAGGAIQCGSYTGNGSSSGPTVSLGWEPQWLLIKRADDIGGWFMFDSARGAGTGVDAMLYANSNAAEDSSTNFLDMASSGFQIKNAATEINSPANTYLYVAIRA